MANDSQNKPTRTRHAHALAVGLPLLAASLGAAAAPTLRIVALQPSLTEAVCALDSCAQLVGVDRYSRFPAAVEALPRVGGFSDADIEAIFALQPDLVLVNRRNRAAERLRSLGLRVVVLDTSTLDDVHQSLERIAQELGRPGAGEALWQRILARLERIGEQLPPGWRGRRVYLELHDGKAAASRESFLGQLLERIGLISVVPAGMGPFPRLTPEWVLRTDPDVVITPAVSLRPPAQRPGWPALRALREQRLCTLAPDAIDLLLRAGPRLDEAATQILDCLRDLPPP